MAQLVGISIAPAPGEAYYIPVGHTGMMQSPQLPLNLVVEKLKPIFADGTKAKIAHNAKFDMEVLAEVGITVTNLDLRHDDRRLSAQRTGARPEISGIQSAQCGDDPDFQPDWLRQ